MKYTVIGFPVGHSLSPPMQNAAFAACGFGGAVYDKTSVEPEKIAEFVAFARTRLNGFNLTVPHKTAILPFLAECDPLARRAGSVNTVMVRDGRLEGFSTDGYGLEMALAEAFHLDLTGKNILFCGCGGVAHATAFHLASRGVGKLFLFNRTVAKAEILAENMMSAVPGAVAQAGNLADRAALAAAIAECDVLIQATSSGLKDADEPPFDLSLLDAGRGKIRVFDTIYRETPVWKAAHERKIPCANGLAMLLYQGAKSFEIWTGKKAPVDVMRRALIDAGGIFLCS